MKILHFADVHLGSSTWGRRRIDAQTGLSSSIFQIAGYLERMVDKALDEGVDLALFAGDAYRSSDPSPTLQTFFLKPILRLLTEGVAVVMIPGNHDIPGILKRAHSLELASLFSIHNLHILDKPKSLHLVSTKAGEVGIIALPWVNRMRLLTSEELSKRSAPEITELMSGKLAATAREFVEAAPTSVPLIMLAHQAVSGSTRSGSEKLMVWGDTPILPAHLFTDERIAYSALGHLHIHQDLNPQGPVHAVYSGSMERLDFSDEGVEKGYIIANLVGRFFVPTFYPTEARKFLSINLKLKPGEILGDKLSEKLDEEKIAGAVVRISIETVGKKLSDSELLELRNILASAYDYMIDINEPQSDILEQMASLSLDLSPEKNIAAYLKLKDKEIGELREEVRAYALGLIQRRKVGEES